MPDKERDGKTGRPLRVRDLAVALGWAMLGPSLIVGTVALLLAVGLARNADPEASPVLVWSAAAVLCLGIPIALALWRHWGDRQRVLLTCAWLPTVTNVVGVALATVFIPDLMGTALRSPEWVVQGHFGDSHPTTRALSALGHATADSVDPGGEVLPEPLLDETSLALDQAIIIPYSEDGAAAFIDVTLEGDEGELDLTYLFDTGASYTTITSEVAQQLGVEVPEDAPVLEFNTATGLRKSKMAYLPALTLGGVRIPGLLVSICDSCGTEKTAGLLGLNVTRKEFVGVLGEEQMRLVPRIHEARPNRAYDIEPMVDKRVEGRSEIWFGRVHWVIEVTNLATVPIDDVLPRVDFRDGPTLFGKRIRRIEPGETARSLLQGRVSDERSGGSVEYTLTLEEAYW